MNTALVGHTGTIGSSLINTRTITHRYNSANINDLRQYHYELVIVAAPSGNRLTVAEDPTGDAENIAGIIQELQQTQIKRIILISTVDTIARPDTAYGRNRLALENAVKELGIEYHILRLSTLVGKTIKKNVLFDLKNNQFVHKINAKSVIQWCLLDQLSAEIDWVINNNVQELNLVSEPICNQDLIDKFFPGVNPGSQALTVQYDVHPYRYSRSDIYLAIGNYLQ